MFLHTNYLAVYYSLYKLNNKELTASCCVKKVDNCNAKCYFDKKMNDEENKSTNGDAALPDSKLKITEYVVSDDTSFPIISAQNKVHAIPDHLYLNDFISEIDHPPQ